MFYFAGKYELAVERAFKLKQKEGLSSTDLEFAPKKLNSQDIYTDSDEEKMATDGTEKGKKKFAGKKRLV